MATINRNELLELTIENREQRKPPVGFPVTIKLNNGQTIHANIQQYVYATNVNPENSGHLLCEIILNNNSKINIMDIRHLEWNE